MSVRFARPGVSWLQFNPGYCLCVDAGLAALIGAGTGSLATLLGNALQLRKDELRHRRELADAKQSRLLDRRLVAHEALYSVLMKKIDYAESGTTDSDYPESRKAMWTSLDRVQVISSADVSAAAETAVRAVALVEQDLAVEVPDPLRSSELEQRIASLRPVVARYREMLVAEVGASE